MRVIKINKFVAEKDKVNWLIEGLLPDVGWTLFYGTAGLGKTTFAMQMCAALQAGDKFLERKVIKTPILYFQADSVTAEWRMMLQRISPDCEGYTAIEVPTGALGTREYVESMMNAVAVFKPGFIVFDSLYNLSAESINTERVLVSIAKMREITNGKPWLLIHHPPHEGSRAAGHSSIGATSSNIWGLIKTKLKIDKGRLVADKEILLTRDTNGLWTLHKGRANDLIDPTLDGKW